MVPICDCITTCCKSCKKTEVIGVRVRNKANGEESFFLAPLVVSDIGPRATHALLHNRQITQAQVLKQQSQPAESRASIPEQVTKRLDSKCTCLAMFHSFPIKASCTAWIHSALLVWCANKLRPGDWRLQASTYSSATRSSKATISKMKKDWPSPICA